MGGDGRKWVVITLARSFYGLRYEMLFGIRKSVGGGGMEGI